MASAGRGAGISGVFGQGRARRSRGGSVRTARAGARPLGGCRGAARAAAAGAACAAALALAGCVLPLRPPPLEAEPRGLARAEVPAAVAEHLAGAIRIPTVSTGDPERWDPAPFEAFHRYLEGTFPRFHRVATRERVEGYSLLYRWRGSDPSLRPLLLLAHMDVVPADPAGWSHDPFGGEIVGGEVWGRGALDDKGSLVGILEAMELLARSGARPRRTILLAFGHDEEVGGRGAQAIAARLRAEGVEPELVLDEGMAVVEGVVPGVEGPVALVGVAEKGYLSLELVARAEGGHSSQPPPQTAIGILAAGLARLEAHPMPVRFSGPFRDMLAELAPYMPYRTQLALRNLWIARPLVVRRLVATRPGNAALRTTTAITMFHAGVKDNVLPKEARAVVNFRLHPEDTVEEVVERVRRTLGDDRIEVGIYRGYAWNASPVAPRDAEAFRAIEATIREVFGPVPVAPGLVLGGTDARHYAILTDRVYRFSPARMRPELLRTIHGVDERMAIENLVRGVRFYARLAERLALEPGGAGATSASSGASGGSRPSNAAIASSQGASGRSR